MIVTCRYPEVEVEVERVKHVAHGHGFRFRAPAALAEIIIGHRLKSRRSDSPKGPGLTQPL